MRFGPFDFSARPRRKGKIFSFRHRPRGPLSARRPLWQIPAPAAARPRPGRNPYDFEACAPFGGSAGGVLARGSCRRGGQPGPLRAPARARLSAILHHGRPQAGGEACPRARPRPCDDAMAASRHAVRLTAYPTVWDKPRGNMNVMGVAALNRQPAYLNTRAPNIKSLRDFTDK